MKFFCIAALFGALQMAVTAFLIRFAAAGKKGFTFLIFCSKLALYVAGAVLFVFKFLSGYMYIISGYAVGLALAAVVLFFYAAVFKNEEDE